MIDVPVKLGARSYRILVGAGLLSQAGPEISRLGVGRRLALLTDPAIQSLYGEIVAQSLAGAGFDVTTVLLPEGERAKTLEVAASTWDRLLEAGLDRGSAVVALGGGAVGDLAGFVAATYMRGMHFVQLPTTLLAQVDASIGGKTAIDHPRAKNLIGAFHQPRLVLVDPDVVVTLSDREFRSGLAEVVKHGIVADAAYFGDVERHAGPLLARDLPTLERVIGGSCRIKASVVERDEQETELRAMLNYGHTVGHALEASAGYGRFAHGEAVSIGIAAAARLAHRLGLAFLETVLRQERLLEALGLPVRLADVDHAALLAAIGRDKKARDGTVPFVLAPRIGEFRLVFDVPPDAVRAVLAELTHAEIAS